MSDMKTGLLDSVEQNTLEYQIPWNISGMIQEIA